MKTKFNADWLEWIRVNVQNGQDKDGLFKILLDEGYTFDAIKTQLRHTPTKPISQLINPLKQAGLQQRTHRQPMANFGEPTDRRKIFIPNCYTLNSNALEMYTLFEFLSPSECDQIIQAIRSKLRPSELSSEDSDANYRTSRTCDLGTLDDPFIAQIDSRICQLLGINPDYSEVIQGQFYEPGQEFKAHTDYFEPKEMAEHASVMGQRTYTVMIYLNEVEAGGETEFTHVNQTLSPQTGLAVIWNSLNPDGSPNLNSMHRAHPVLKGYKAVITKWFRSRPRSDRAGAMYTKSLNEFTQNYTKTGLHKTTLNPQLFNKITQFYRRNTSHAETEHVPGNFIENTENNSEKSSSLIELTPELKQNIHDELKPLISEWSQQPLEPTYVYGIREYHRGAALKMHRDRIETHILSAIINVSQEVDEDWPLVIEDNAYRIHHIMLKPGEMIFYEGCRLLHGRPIPLKGESFANIFCHFKPSHHKVPTA